MADQTVPQLTAATSLNAEDLFYVVRDPNGTAVDRKITQKNFFGSIAQNTVITSAVVTVTANTTVAGLVVINSGSNAAFDFQAKSGSDAGIFLDAGNTHFGIGTTTPQTKLDVNSDKVRIRTALTPASSNAVTVGVKTGTIFWDSGYIYVVTDSNTIKRASLASF